MKLSDVGIVNSVTQGELVISPFQERSLQPASYDIHLGPWFITFDDESPDVRTVNPQSPTASTKRHTATVENPFVLEPGQFALASTVEWVELGASIAARLEGKSTLGRLGLLTHATAGFIDPGFKGTITLELYNIAPHALILRPGMAIGQLCFEQLDQEAAVPYGSPGLGSKYQGQGGPTAARARHWSAGRL